MSFPLFKRVPVLFFVLMTSSLLAQDLDLQFTRVSELRGIVDIANAGDGTGRLFLVQQRGFILIHKNTQGVQSTFLNIQSRVNSSEQEQGLLSVAFAPDYATSGFFYVWYTDGGGGTVLSRFKVSDDPDKADPDSEQLVLTVAQPFFNHNGGRIQFGPDGMLYLGLGDGGGSGDPQDNGQDGSTLLGKLIRIDVDPAHGTYAIPAGNPFTSNGSVRSEIWALGLRNPWKISFDRVTGDLFIADVGQGQVEEVSFQAAGSGGGQNYGWNIMEGSRCFSGSGCNDPSLTLPVAEYSHDDGCSVTGGEVYRGGTYPAFDGMYFYGDFCSGNVWGLTHDGNQWNSALLAETNHLITSFGLDEDGNVYMASQTQGIYLLSDGDPVPSFTINAGLNDAWYDPETDGQGFLISVFEDSGLVFLAWFTYDVERPPDDVTAILGEPGHRWLTAQGLFEGDTAVLEVNLSSGGVFDSAEPAAESPVKVGTITIVWKDCNSALLSYDLTSPPVSGEIDLERIVTDNVVLCEALQMP